MLPIAELVRVSRSCDDSWQSPLGEAAAEAWGLRSAVFVRSSANHVFVARPAVLRARPGPPDAAPRWAALLAESGAPVAAALPSPNGRLVEAVQWVGTAYGVTAYECVEGETRTEDLPATDIRRWGATLAGLHAVTVATDGLPRWLEGRLRPSAESLTGEGEVVARGAAATVAAVAALPRDAALFGPLHGDPELDNLVWSAHGPVFVDLDDAAIGWFVGDVGFALRDFAQVAVAPDPGHPVVAAFLEGYRSRRPLTDEELSWLPVLTRAHAVVELARLRPVLAAAPDPGWPDWATRLDARVRARADLLTRVIGQASVPRRSG